MKQFTCIIMLAFLTINCFGQLPDDFIAPDFTVEDIDGTERNLYDILDEGKTVILDIYATWCGPCWTFHTDHVLADIWEEMGPNGTDEVFVMSIESDLSTTIDQLNGIGEGTQGNWVEGTPYPMVDEIVGEGGYGDISNSFLVTGFPSIFFICPDRSVTDINWQYVEDEYQDIIGSCPSSTGANNCRVINYYGVEGVICSEESFTPTVSFQNMGAETVSSALFEFTINGTTEEVLWEGELNPFQFGEVSFSNVAASSTDILVEITEVNQGPDDNPDDNSLSTSILAPLVTEEYTVTVEVMTDEYGDETYWGILNENDELIASGGNQLIGFDLNADNNDGVWPPPSDETAYENNTLYSTEVNLPAVGCYRLVVADYYGDGLCCDYGDGYFKVISQDIGDLVDATGQPFELSSENPFGFDGAVSMDEISDVGMNLFPNPFVDELNIALFDKATDIQSITVFNLEGKTTFTESNVSRTNSNVKIDLSTLQSGLYLLQIQLKDGKMIQEKIYKR